jgi:hypothetical protein
MTLEVYFLSTYDTNFLTFILKESQVKLGGLVIGS